MTPPCSPALIVGGTAAAPGAALPGGQTLPADFTSAGGCNLKPAAKPRAMVTKGEGGTRTYTVMCASGAPAPIRAALGDGLASLTTMRASVATQPASAAVPESERTHALGAIDGSMREKHEGDARGVALALGRLRAGKIRIKSLPATPPRLPSDG